MKTFLWRDILCIVIEFVAILLFYFIYFTLLTFSNVIRGVQQPQLQGKSALFQGQISLLEQSCV